MVSHVSRFSMVQSFIDGRHGSGTQMLVSGISMPCPWLVRAAGGPIVAVVIMWGMGVRGLAL